MVGLISLCLLGCATGSRPYDDTKVRMIKKEATTESELVEWFGPPASRNMRGDGSKTLSWKFRATNPGATSGRLEVSLDPNGKVLAYSASSGMK